MWVARARLLLEVRVAYRLPTRSEAEQFRRDHAENVLNRIANTYFQQDAYMTAFKKHAATELLLEGLALPTDLKFEG